MSGKEARRVYVMEQVKDGKVTVRQAAEYLGLSERQVKRLKKGMKQEGVSALAHHNRGRNPKHTISEDIRTRIVSLAAGIYKGASSQHMAELLARNQEIVVSASSIRRILKKAGVTSSRSRKRKGRRSRDRAPQEGLLEQIDASPFDWLEDRGPRMSLHGAIDDATGKVVGLHFRPTEDLRGYFEVLRQMVTAHGIPRAVYTDGHAIFFSTKKDKLTIEEELQGKQVPLTQLGGVLDKLGVNHIHARSPQAKGRVERLWGTLQERLTLELRVAGISDIQSANAFLPGFIKDFNRRFQVEPQNPEPAFAPGPSRQILDRIICFKEDRLATNGSVISYHGQVYRLVDSSGAVLSVPPRAKVTVATHLDGSTEALYNSQGYSLAPFQEPPVKEALVPEAKEQTRTGHKPVATHPWIHQKIMPPTKEVDLYFRDRYKRVEASRRD